MQSRRLILRATAATIPAAALAGCTSSDDDGDGNGGGNDGGGGDSDSDTPTETPTPIGTQLTDIVEITDHEWRGRTILEATVRNKTETTIDTLQIDVNVYAGDERISDGYGTISDLPGGIEDTVRVSNMSDYSAVPCEEATRYDLVPNFYFDGEDYEERMEFEYDPSFCEE